MTTIYMQLISLYYHQQDFQVLLKDHLFDLKLSEYLCQGHL